MANTKTAKKTERKIEKRTRKNVARRSRVRTYLRRVENAIAKGDKSAATAALRDAEPEIQRAAGKGTFHRNLASRKVSRLSKRINALGA